MSLVAVVVGTVAATNAADAGICGRILIAIAAAALFGLIGFVPLFGDGLKAAPRPEWTVVEGDRKARPPVDGRLQSEGLTIDGTVGRSRRAAEAGWLRSTMGRTMRTTGSSQSAPIQLCPVAKLIRKSAQAVRPERSHRIADGGGIRTVATLHRPRQQAGEINSVQCASSKCMLLCGSANSGRTRSGV